MPDNNIHKFSIEITDKQFYGLQIIEFGMKKIIFQLLIDDLLELFAKHSPGKVMGAIVSRSIGLKEICKLSLEEAKNVNNSKPA
jgi:hypothetical protein